MLYVIIVAAIIVFWLVAIDRPVLKVTVNAGEITKVKGHFPPAFKSHLLEIGRATPFDGQIKVYHQRTSMKLVLSKGIPKKVQQRIRNVFPHQGFKSQPGITKKSR